ncbi:MAG: hypothetical protein HLUCCA11_23140 [Phormidesmis priestleyi Ana]|uniref:Uncharacterized protein n=1 Tax=Phormidesmis priestleyi Ana TaxID=1666911 RepID=A0A0P7ZAM2_9CYAN|nr:MAG: hypothetical protein HLUCCA11_23140 [Phormidesmis priestleyi Ana]
MATGVKPLSNGLQSSSRLKVCSTSFLAFPHFSRSHDYYGITGSSLAIDVAMSIICCRAVGEVPGRLMR